ncbi:MAG: AAA family ATPase [Candidatus Eisenbacteria bacterium]|nr:cytidylate kinase-like family protein [Candidatus Eisenbacteria bacterium]
MTGIEQIIDRQIRRWELEADLRRRAAAESRTERPTPLRPVITISRAFGSGGGEVAHRLAASLGYQIFDREIVNAIVEQSKFQEAIAASLDEHDLSSVRLWIEGLLHGKFLSKGDYLHTLARVLGTIAMHGHAVILGRGANFLLDPARSLHVRIVAPFAQRVETISRLRQVSFEEAERLVQKVDEERRHFFHTYFSRSPDDPLSYDLCLNTAGIGIENCIVLIERALRQKLAIQPNVQF